MAATMVAFCPAAADPYFLRPPENCGSGYYPAFPPNVINCCVLQCRGGFNLDGSDCRDWLATGGSAVVDLSEAALNAAVWIIAVPERTIPDVLMSAGSWSPLYVFLGWQPLQGAASMTPPDQCPPWPETFEPRDCNGTSTRHSLNARRRVC